MRRMKRTESDSKVSFPGFPHAWMGNHGLKTMFRVLWRRTPVWGVMGLGRALQSIQVLRCYYTNPMFMEHQEQEQPIHTFG